MLNSLLEKMVIWFVIKLQKKTQKPPERHQNTQKKKDIYLKKKERKLLMAYDWYNSVIMENQKITTFSDYTPNHSCKFRPKKWVEIDDQSH